MSEKPSKTARKREYLALQALGEKLVDLTEEQLAGIPLDDNLREAVLTARTIRSHGALRRQRQLIGKLMAQVDAEPIRQAFESLGRADRAGKAVFRQSEGWRDRVLAEGESAVDDLEKSLGQEVPGLAEAARDYRSSRSDAAKKRAARQVFRAIHGSLAAAGDDEKR